MSQAATGALLIRTLLMCTSTQAGLHDKRYFVLFTKENIYHYFRVLLSSAHISALSSVICAGGGWQ